MLGDMDDPTLDLAQVHLTGATPNARCPCCQGSDWKGLPDVSWLHFTRESAPGTTGSEEVGFDVEEGLSELDFGQQPVVGLFCGGCGFVRWHVPLNSGRQDGIDSP